MAKSLHDLVRNRADGRCEYCRLPQAFTRERFQIEHVIARQHRGGDDETNLALSCMRCNLYKGPNIAGRDPETGSLVPLYNPRSDRWDDHFAWNGARLQGITATGRTTLSLLNMNDPQRVALRQLLLDAGDFHAH